MVLYYDQNKNGTYYIKLNLVCPTNSKFTAKSVTYLNKNITEDILKNIILFIKKMYATYKVLFNSPVYANIEYYMQKNLTNFLNIIDLETNWTTKQKELAGDILTNVYNYILDCYFNTVFSDTANDYTSDFPFDFDTKNIFKSRYF